MEDFPTLVNPHDDSIVPITSSSFSIGRSLSCDHIIQSLNVSRFHCCIKKTNNKWTLFDRSSNGTLVNSTLYKFNESVDLKYGDVIKLGPDDLEFVFTAKKSNPGPVTEVVNNDAGSQVTDPVLVEEFQQPFEVEASESQTTTKTDPNVNSDMMETELTCSICSELFIKAVTLNCSHTFCRFCIDQWKKNKLNCPICRKLINTVAPTLVLDNFIEKFIETQSDDVKETRKTLIQQRDEIVGSTAGSSSVATDNINNSTEVIQISSDNDDMSDYTDDYSDDEEYLDYDDCDFDTGPYVRSRGAYYGGYGRCFICNQSGHWANSCPLKRR